MNSLYISTIIFLFFFLPLCLVVLTIFGLREYFLYRKLRKLVKKNCPEYKIPSLLLDITPKGLYSGITDFLYFFNKEKSLDHYRKSVHWAYLWKLKDKEILEILRKMFVSRIWRVRILTFFFLIFIPCFFYLWITS